MPKNKSPKKAHKKSTHKTVQKSSNFFSRFLSYFVHTTVKPAPKKKAVKRKSTTKKHAAKKRKTTKKRTQRSIKKQKTPKRKTVKSSVATPVATKRVKKQEQHGVFEPTYYDRKQAEAAQAKQELQKPVSNTISQEKVKNRAEEKPKKEESMSHSDGLNIEFAGEEEGTEKQTEEELLQQSTAQKAKNTKEEEKLKREMETEGIFEINDEKPEKEHSLLSFMKGDRSEKKALTKAELKEQAKKEKQEEEEWSEEAERREKLIVERKKKHKKEKQEEGKNKKKKWRIPEKQKQNPFQAFLASMKYMGLGKEKIAFIDNLGTMMDAGLPLLDALRSLQKETRTRPMKKLMGRIIVAVEMGSSLWRAMEGQYFFSQQQIAMIRVGEEAGNLVENLQYLSVQEEKDRQLRSKVKTAMIYPIIVLTMLTIIVFGLGMFVLPSLISVIESLGVPLPFVTRMIVAFTKLFSEKGTIILPSFLAGVLVFALLTKFTNFKVFVQWTLYKIPGIGVLIREATLSRFGVVLGGLLQAGVPVTEALDSLVSATSLVRYKNFYAELSDHIKIGDSFATSFESIKSTNKCFPSSMQQLVVTGEQSGSLTIIMLKISEIHEKKASETAEKLPVILEPLLLLFIGGLVAVIALGILAPIYSVVGNIGKA